MSKLKKVANKHPPPEHHIANLAPHGNLLFPKDHLFCALPKNQKMKINPEQKLNPRENAGIQIAREVGKEKSQHVIEGWIHQLLYSLRI